MGVKTAEALLEIWVIFHCVPLVTVRAASLPVVDDAGSAVEHIRLRHNRQHPALGSSAQVLNFNSTQPENLGVAGVGIDHTEIRTHAVNSSQTDAVETRIPSNVATTNESAAEVETEAGCPGCAQSRLLLEQQATEEEIRAMRLEAIKKQILRKLRLKEPPNVTLQRSSIPKPLSHGEILPKGREMFDTANKNVDDFYGKTEQIVTFPEEDTPVCHSSHPNPHACFTFHIPGEVQADDIATAELWAYKLPDRRDKKSQMFIISELIRHSDINLSRGKRKNIAIERTNVREGWVKFDIKWMLKRWVRQLDLTHVIQISCKTCTMNPALSPVSEEKDKKPFIVINTANTNQLSRERRSLNCGPDVSECCKEQLTVSFKELGWDDWIIFPLEFHANYCHGSCSNGLSLAKTKLEHPIVLQKFLQVNGRKFSVSKREGIAPCCAATRMSSLTIFSLDNANTIKQTLLPNMIVDACGCM